MVTINGNGHVAVDDNDVTNQVDENGNIIIQGTNGNNISIVKNNTKLEQLEPDVDTFAAMLVDGFSKFIPRKFLTPSKPLNGADNKFK